MTTKHQKTGAELVKWVYILLQAMNHFQHNISTTQLLLTITAFWDTAPRVSWKYTDVSKVRTAYIIS
jgi:hypothetical protein